jgi:glycosyltransferase involved in cell wall biosynthesis
MHKKVKLLLISNSPGPNQNDFFEEISRREGIELVVWFMGRKALKWRGSEPKPTYNHRFLTNVIPFAEQSQFFLNPSILWRLPLASFDLVLIQGYFMPASIISMLILSLTGRNWIFWGEIVNRANDKNGWRYYIKSFILSEILSKFSSLILVIGGQKAKDSYLEFGCDESNLTFLPYSCNLSSYYSLDDSQNKVFHQLIKAYKSFGERVIFTLAQLIPRKCVNFLIEAFLTLNPEESNLRLLIGGDGPDKDYLCRMVPRNIESRVSFLGFLPKSAQPAYYKLADVFVLPSREDGWGMVVAEALASGTPVVTTTGVTSAYELIREGINGYVVKPESVEELSTAIKHCFGLATTTDQATISTTAKVCDAGLVAQELEEILQVLCNESL